MIPTMILVGLLAGRWPGAIALLLLIGAVTLAAGREDRAMDSGETGQTTAAAACGASVLERANESRLAYSPRFCAAG